MVTEAGKLNAGYELDGALHIDFVMRPATIADAFAAIEKAGDAPSGLKLRIFKAAEQMISLGSLDKQLITGDLLLSLSEEDIEPIFDAQDAVEKKRKSSKSALNPTSSSATN